MNVALLKDSFDMIAPHKDAFALSCYQQLFTDYPQAQPLFAQTNMRRQEGALMAALATVIAGVQRGDNLIPTLQRLGQRHKGYGIKAEHYPILRVVLLETFHHYLGPRFTPQMQEAWEEAFEMISAEMLKGADMLPSLSLWFRGLSCQPAPGRPDDRGGNQYHSLIETF